MFWIRGKFGVKETSKHPFVLVPNAKEPSFVRSHPDLCHFVGEICSFQLFPPLEDLFQLCFAQCICFSPEWSMCCWDLPYLLFTLFNFEVSRFQGEGAQVLQISSLCSPPQTSTEASSRSAASKSPWSLSGMQDRRHHLSKTWRWFLRCPSKSERHCVSPLIVLISQLVVGIRGMGVGGGMWW